MKIYLSDYWRKNALFNLCVMIFIILGTIAFCLWSRNEEDYIFVLCALAYVVVYIGLLLNSIRFLTYIIIEENHIKSYSFFNKGLCTVETDKTMYYAVFISSQGVWGRKKFIAISNTLFKFDDEPMNIFKKRFIARYNQRELIVMPYEQETIRVVRANNGIKIN